MATALKNPNSGHRKRLRERFLRAGLEGLQDYEAIELVLTFAIPRHDVKPLPNSSSNTTVRWKNCSTRLPRSCSTSTDWAKRP